ncbi:MAG: Hpt domain-containing protein, partial [Pseudomonadales bacterium]|nr:Hpt domain-containing protein [Pseudomonadales bacterium]
EIFVEEVGEVLETVDQWIPQWRADLSSEEALSEVRRAFHTLKGSGRIVGANVIGEVAWSVENMLNRLIDGTVQPSDEFVQVVEEARSLVPVLRDAFEIRASADMNAVGWIMERADMLSSGGNLEDAQPEDVGAEGAETGADTGSTDAGGADTQDDDTMTVFLGEANVHLETLARSAQDSGVALTEASLRALHTLSGSAGMAGIEAVADLARPTYELASTLRGDEDRTLTGEFGDYLRRAIAALLQTVNDLEAGIEPEDHFQLIAEVDHLIVAASELPEVEQAAAAQSLLMGLDGLAVLMDTPDYLRSWHEGAMDLEFGEKLQAALDEVGEVAAAENHGAIAGLCRALGAAHEHLAHEVLTDSTLTVLERGQERLLGLFDALAAEQTPEPVDDTIAELAKLLETVAFEEDEPLLLEDEPPALNTLYDLDVPADEAAAGGSDAEPEMAAPEKEDGAIESREEALDRLESAEIDSDTDTLGDDEISLESLSDELLADIAREASRSSRPAEVRTEKAASGDRRQEELQARQQAASPPPSSGASEDLLPDDLDAEIIEVFFEEADELLEALEADIDQWKSEPENRVHLEHLLRGLHTLKGGARLTGLSRLGDATHQFESFLIDVQSDGSATGGEFFTDLHGRFDELTGLLASVRRALSGEATGNAAPATPSHGHGENLELPKPPAAGRTRQETEPADTETPATSNVRPIKRDPVAPAVREPASAQSASVKTAGKEPREARTAQEMVRVGSGLLESLVNLAGESSIIRARVEQGLSDFTNSLDEMETTIERLREQLRRLEIETETQILFRQDRPEGPAYADFDPLEMDRYSQLQQLSRGLSESASDMLDLKDTLLFKARESETLLLQQARVNTELQEGLMRTRMVPFSRLLPRLRRIVRQVAGELNKDVELHAYNAEGELDRSLLERMVPPLEHMLRNAVDHGIESPELRKNYGKPPAGRIDLRLSREGGDVVIEISDDGAGIDVETVRAKAVERGLMADSAKLRDDEIIQFVLAPGFSTAKSVTQISGRGVGMDVVHSEVKQLGGSIQIASRTGRGTRFVLRVPFTVSVNRALMVSVGDDLYAIPLNNIEGIVLLSPNELERLYAPDGNTFEYAGIPYRVRYLGHYLGREFRAVNQPSSIPVVLVRSGDHAVAVHVDSVQGSREIVVKSLGPQFAGVGGISGATILGDGSVVVILDLLALIRAQGGESFLGSKRSLGSGVRTRCVMVVDDSVTVRKVTSRLLERQGMDVIVAKDGVEAVALLQERRPDVMLLDIEMPRM